MILIEHDGRYSEESIRQQRILAEQKRCLDKFKDRYDGDDEDREPCKEPTAADIKEMEQREAEFAQEVEALTKLRRGARYFTLDPMKKNSEAVPEILETKAGEKAVLWRVGGGDALEDFLRQ